MSWFNSSASSVQAWLDFNGTLPTISNCHDVEMGRHEVPRVKEAGCTTVCNRSLALYSPPYDNLVTRELWTTLISAYTTIGPEKYLVPNSNNQSTHLFRRFQELGFNDDVHEQALAVADSISSLLQLLYFDAKFLTSSNDGTTPSACTRSMLFPLGSIPDLAGIGVSSLLERH